MRSVRGERRKRRLKKGTWRTELNRLEEKLDEKRIGNNIMREKELTREQNIY